MAVNKAVKKEERRETVNSRNDRKQKRTNGSRLSPTTVQEAVHSVAKVRCFLIRL
jgi:hypothetical protein